MLAGFLFAVATDVEETVRVDAAGHTTASSSETMDLLLRGQLLRRLRHPTNGGATLLTTAAGVAERQQETQREKRPIDRLILAMQPTE